MLFDLAQKHYFAEIDRKDRINSSISITLTISGIFFALVAPLIDLEFHFQRGYSGEVLLLTSLFSAVLSFKNAVSVFGFKYEYVNVQSNVFEWRDELARHFFDDKKSILQAMRNELAEDYIKCLNINAPLNDF